MKLFQLLINLLNKFKLTQTEFLWNGKEINLTSEDIIIKSNNFNVDKNGNLTCNNAQMNDANIIGGSVELSGASGDIKFKTYNVNNRNSNVSITPISVGIYDSSYTELPLIHMGIGESGSKKFGGIRLINNYNDGEETQIDTYGITTPTLTQTSLASKKKNFEKLENALDIIKQIDIYKYNLKDEKDTDKKHIGFVIGENYNYSKELTSKENNGADIYSLASCCLQAIKEQQIEIEKLKNKIKEMEVK